jgi:hypothetical protein
MHPASVNDILSALGPDARGLQINDQVIPDLFTLTASRIEEDPKSFFVQQPYESDRWMGGRIVIEYARDLSYTLVTAPVFVYNMVSFDPVDLLKTIEKYQITFTSLVPTHYIMILALPEEVKSKYDVSSIRQLLISSAPARKDLKMAIMQYFKNAELWEATGPPKAAW